MIGELIIESQGQVTRVRVLPGGRTEMAEQGSGSVLGLEAAWLATTVSTPMPDGIVTGQGNGVITTVDGDVVMVKKSGIGWPTGKEGKQKRGVLSYYPIAETRALEQCCRLSLSRMEKGDWTAKIWEWR